jgi:hypothetical protein
MLHVAPPGLQIFFLPPLASDALYARGDVLVLDALHLRGISICAWGYQLTSCLPIAAWTVSFRAFMP